MRPFMPQLTHHFAAASRQRGGGLALCCCGFSPHYSWPSVLLVLHRTPTVYFRRILLGKPANYSAMVAVSAAVLLLLLPAAVVATQGSDDWLLAVSPEASSVVEGTLDGVPTLTLQNGLASRTFALVGPPTPPPGPTPAPPPPPGPCPSWCTGCQGGVECCANPGGRLVHGPDKGEVYPYYGKPCVQQSDCGKCTLDGTCICGTIASNLSASCCKPLHSNRTTNATGFATVALSREGHAGREHECGAQLLRASAPEAVLTLDGKGYGIGGLVGQHDYAFLNTSLLHSWSADPDAFVYKTHRTGVPEARYEWSPGVRHSDSTLHWPPRGITLGANERLLLRLFYYK